MFSLVKSLLVTSRILASNSKMPKSKYAFLQQNQQPSESFNYFTYRAKIRTGITGKKIL